MSDKIMEATLEAELRSTSRMTDKSTDEVREIVLYIDNPSFRYKNGQSIGVIVPGEDEFGCANHKRRYSIVGDPTDTTEQGLEFRLLVRRCFYIDEFSGEKYPGRASNYLCDAKVGDKILITGPYSSPFNMPEDKNANILMIGTGTGIAPFRSFIEQIYKQQGDWNGQVRLFYGAKTGLDLLYMNDKNNDLTNYYQEETFKAYNALTNKHLSGDEKGLENSLKSNIDEVWELINHKNTYVFIAGLSNVLPSLDMVMCHAAGSDDKWDQLKQKLIIEKRWSKLLY